MKAALCTTPGRLEDITLSDIAEPACPPDGLLVRVHAAGVNFPDVLLARGQYQEKPALPFAPGLELAGSAQLPFATLNVNDTLSLLEERPG